jgi:hypothetical protein
MPSMTEGITLRERGERRHQKESSSFCHVQSAVKDPEQTSSNLNTQDG